MVAKIRIRGRGRKSRLVVPDEALAPVVRIVVGKTPGDWVWDVKSGKGWMRRVDGKIGTLSERHCSLLRQAEERGKKSAARMRRLVAQRITR